MQNLARYWATEYDWRKCEAKLNALPQFITEIDGLDIHFVHVRSKQENALPIIITHGWPGSTIEQMKIIDPLTNPTAHGASADDAFDVVIPSIPGYGYSAKPTATGWDPARIARAWAVLMERLGYKKYVAQGGDWGAIITDGWPCRRRRDCSAFTRTWRAPFRRKSRRRSRPVPRHRRVSPLKRRLRSRS
jgi:pimeloyl-ACP methyl ester carboxylesterase